MNLHQVSLGLRFSTTSLERMMSGEGWLSWLGCAVVMIAEVGGWRMEW